MSYIAPQFIIGGVNYAKYIRMDGLDWGRNDLDSEESGRTQDALMHRSVLGKKRTLDISLTPVSFDVLHKINEAIGAPFVDVTFLDPHSGQLETVTFYGSSIRAKLLFSDGYEHWYSEGTFSLIEK